MRRPLTAPAFHIGPDALFEGRRHHRLDAWSELQVEGTEASW